jgi:hypothetical protein
MTRREFSLEAALAILGTCVITVSDCGGSKTPTQPTPTDVNGTISNNHGHKAAITGAQIVAGAAIELDIRGDASHPHTVSISQADLNALRNRQTVTHDSTNNNNHIHTVTFTPA